MAKPEAPGVQVRRWEGGRWSDSPDAVVTEEPLQLLLNGAPLSIVMRTPGHDVELALGLLWAERVVTDRAQVASLLVSAESGESETSLPVRADLLESNQVDVRLTSVARRPE